MAAWSKGAILNAIPFWKPKRPEVDLTELQNLNVPVEANMKLMMPPSFKERLKKQQGPMDQATEFINNITNTPTSENSDYLSQAEALIFQANQVRQRAQQKRLKKSMPIFKPGKTIMNTYPVNVPTPVPVAGAAGGIGVGSKNPGKGIFTSSAGLNSLAPGQLLGGRGGTTNLANFIQAISGEESGGNYGAVNPSSGAMGKYQIMPANISGPGGWDREALGRDITTQQFMQSPKLQEAIAKFKLGQYYKKYGAAGAASAWYSGSPTKWKTSTGAQGAYPSIHNYVLDILRAMKS